VSTQLGAGPHTIGKWRNRFITDRIEGLYDEMRSGRPRTVEDEAVAELITKTLSRKPKAATHWSVHGTAKETRIAKSTVHRLFQLFGLQPHHTRSFKLSTDPFFVEKLRDVVGLSLNPPEKAVVLCVDEKSQIQALERTQPMLPMGFGNIEGVTHDYQRHGTTTLFAALNVLDGADIAQCKPRHRHREFLAFLRHIEANVPAQLDVHLVVDNYATHKHPKVRAWLARRPRWHIHFTPTYASWLNQVERFFALITQRAIRRGSFDSTADLVKKIDHSPAPTMQILAPSCGPRPLILSSKNSQNFVSEFPDGTLAEGNDSRAVKARSGQQTLRYPLGKGLFRDRLLDFHRVGSFPYRWRIVVMRRTCLLRISAPAPARQRIDHLEVADARRVKSLASPWIKYRARGCAKALGGLDINGGVLSAVMHLYGGFGRS
jgi:putative transposase